MKVESTVNLEFSLLSVIMHSKFFHSIPLESHEQRSKLSAFYRTASRQRLAMTQCDNSPTFR